MPGRRLIALFSLPLIAGVIMTSCGKAKPAEQDAAEPVLIAQVFDYKLYYDDVKDLMQDVDNPQDSLQQVRSIAEHWVRDRLVLVEAEKNFPKEINLNKLVEDYRQSLVRHFYEQQTMERRLDTVITEADLEAYYETHQEQHRLESGIFRGYCFKIPRPVQRGDKLLAWWRDFPQRHREDVLAYAAERARTNWSDTTQWHEMQRAVQLFPEGTLTPAAIRSQKSIIREDGDYVYLLYPVEAYQAQDVAPLAYIREQAARYILHQRELALLDSMKQEIYDRDIRDERVQIFVR